jgi:hypothetical protein
MAKIISGLGTVSGKIGATVYSHNRWGAYIRSLVIPTQPRTAYQQNQRARIASCAERWHDLTASDRLQWENYATQIVRVDKQGVRLSYNGYTAFMLVNTERLFLGAAIKDDAPIYWQGVQPEGITFDVTATAMTLSVVMAGGGSLATTGNSYLIAWSCPWQSEGAMFARTWRAFSVQAKNTAIPITLTGDWAARFGAIQAADDRRYFLGVTLVELVDAPPGSQSFYISTRVDATVLSDIS